ncbi:MAG: flagellar hook-basal body protein [Burkholderiaceae bacterium]|nr:flagellar hook-basal body protein [Burkholderiaceae bacterium]
MQELMLATLTAMQRNVASLERTANNLANQLTPGYRREILAERRLGSVTPPFQALMTASDVHSTDGGSAHGAEILLDLRPASLKQTAQPLDLAISGAGFFEVATPQGPAYTRRGQFQVDAQGRLVTASGWPVIGHLGELFLNPGPVVITTDATLRQDEQARGQLRLLVAEEPTRLSSIGDGLYVAEGAMRLMPVGEVAIKQGFLEGSNVDTAHEMLQLQRTVRHFETLHRVAQGYDEMMGTALRKLGEL